MVKVAFIGTGSMGGSMSRNLAAAGIDITVFDLNKERDRKSTRLISSHSSVSRMPSSA